MKDGVADRPQDDPNCPSLPTLSMPVQSLSVRDPRLHSKQQNVAKEMSYIRSRLVDFEVLISHLVSLHSSGRSP